MTSTIEGIPHAIENWKNGKGADVKLHMESETYFYHGKMDIPNGQPCEIEVKRGTGEHKGKWEILNIKLVQSNPVKGMPMPKIGHPKSMPQGPPGGPIGPGQMQPNTVQMKYTKFEELYSRGNEFQRRTDALKHATTLYTALFRNERDPKAAAHDVLVMAEILKDWIGKLN